jgi:hypothetical protein
LNNGQGGFLGRAVRGGDGEKPRPIFVGSKKVSVKTVDIGEELLWKKNTQAESTRMGIERGTKGYKHVIARGRSLEEWRPSETGDLRLRERAQWWEGFTGFTVTLTGGLAVPWVMEIESDDKFRVKSAAGGGGGGGAEEVLPHPAHTNARVGRIASGTP